MVIGVHSSSLDCELTESRDSSLSFVPGLLIKVKGSQRNYTLPGGCSRHLWDGRHLAFRNDPAIKEDLNVQVDYNVHVER